MARLTVAALLSCVGAAAGQTVAADAAAFCADYDASLCNGTAFHASHTCAMHYPMLGFATRECINSHLGMVEDADTATLHCPHARGEGPTPGECAGFTFCDDYEASPCSDTPYHATHTCAMHYAMVDQTCAATHLALVVDADSSALHCPHARGEGPCALVVDDGSSDGLVAEAAADTNSTVRTTAFSL